MFCQPDLVQRELDVRSADDEPVGGSEDKNVYAALDRLKLLKSQGIPLSDPEYQDLVVYIRTQIMATTAPTGLLPYYALAVGIQTSVPWRSLSDTENEELSVFLDSELAMLQQGAHRTAYHPNIVQNYWKATDGAIKRFAKRFPNSTLRTKFLAGFNREVRDVFAITDGPECVHCHRYVPGQMKVCARCKLHKYCSAECQKSDWPEHKKICKDLPFLKAFAGQFAG